MESGLNFSRRSANSVADFNEPKTAKRRCGWALRSSAPLYFGRIPYFVTKTRKNMSGGTSPVKRSVVVTKMLTVPRVHS